MKTPKYILIVLFLGILILPNLMMLFSRKNSFQPSSIHPKVLVSEFKSYYAEHYGSKETLLTNYIAFKKNTLKENALPNRIIKGKNDWWFLGNHYNNSLNDAFGVERFSENDLYNISKYLESWDTYLKTKDIVFYILIVPDKNKIYKEHLPFKMTTKFPRVNQLESYLKDKDLNFINLTSTILKAKQTNQVYLKNDTHWSSLGAFSGYKRLLENIQHKFNIKPELLENYSIVNEESYQGDIPRLVYEEDPIIKPYLDKSIYNFKQIFDYEYERHYFNESRETDILLFHDSFMLAMIPFMNETFKNTRFLKSIQLDRAKIEAYQPDIVVLELVERNLSELISLKKPLEN
ncbi:alginate O-acetyltransferase AlgX-related protein [Aurantibacter aestuarii]|uniref:AlgX/AlgJ SGNH hydrolase-like domain-containing protein n=1 Tax=Aurantibacter aestuarii TaxID=1266046 RepID=A0A2T1NDL8_9FLAO|nr:hypothetical protein [Aurantibacter aestuarii]PSG90542.1 hypothetical protein C7H52_04475 [Aurantibacter aestuarii]